jgi:hypothetical protein
MIVMFKLKMKDFFWVFIISLSDKFRGSKVASAILKINTENYYIIIAAFSKQTIKR